MCVCVLTWRQVDGLLSHLFPPAAREGQPFLSYSSRRHRGLKIVNQPAGSGLLDTLKLTPVERENMFQGKGKN